MARQGLLSFHPDKLLLRDGLMALQQETQEFPSISSRDFSVCYVMKINNSMLTVGALIAAFLLCQCVSNRQVTYAPHRTSPSKALSGVVTSSYPVKYTKRSGIGAAIGSVGGAALGSRIGSGYTSRIAGSMGGSLLGGLGGHAAEGALRERHAREITVRAEGRNYKTISDVNPPLREGARVLVLTNVYGHVLSIVPSR